jgi:sulfite dehydrogenase (cytochrome) subunit B
MKFFLSLLIASVVCIARATEVSIELPPETAKFKDAEGVQLAQTFCIQCHSSEYVAMQPPMKRAFWEAEVTKMREKYFAVTPKEMDAKIVDYLLKAYGVSEAK